MLFKVFLEIKAFCLLCLFPSSTSVMQGHDVHIAVLPGLLRVGLCTALALACARALELSPGLGYQALPIQQAMLEGSGEFMLQSSKRCVRFKIPAP